MNKNNLCVCKGVRSCLMCEKSVNHKLQDKSVTYIYCNICGDKAFCQQFKDHSLHSHIDNKYFISINGIFVKEEVITKADETQLVNKIDSIDWINSQSGRRKQDFGPKVNFKKQKIKFNQFLGLPQFDKQLFNKIRAQLSDNYLNDFIAVEVCHLEYTPQNGSQIDSHFDDFWLWGPRLVTVNLLSETILTLVLPQNSGQKVDQLDQQIHVHLPQRSLVVLSGDARYKYEHAIQRQHIVDRRIAITYRELTQQFLPEGPLYQSFGREILVRSSNELQY